MPMHEHFEELCALAVTGQLSEQEHHELVEHMGHCDACRTASEEFAFILDQLPAAVSPRLDGNSTDILSETYRQKFLQRASAEGLRFTEEASSRARSLSFRWGFRRHRHLIIAFAAISFLSLAIPFAGVFRGHFKTEDKVKQRSDFEETPVIQSQVPGKTDSQPSVTAAMLGELERQVRALKSRESELLEQKQRIEAESAKLQQELAVATSKIESQNSQLKKSEQAVSDANAELDRLKSAQGEILASLSSNHAKIEQLSAKVAEDESALNRERELNAAAKDIRRLMAARNVHIVDVYDYDTRGTRDKSFGRVVYTEGESLIFYAFDLGKTDSGSKVTFQAWGQREGIATQPKNLGVFNIDDHEQRRWVLRVDDPKLLSSIDSVFVTVEPSPGRSKPSGKKLLYAFLGIQPNHP